MSNVACRNMEPESISREVEPLTIVDPIDQQLCELVARTLLKHYPGHDWLVEADCRRGFIDIRNVALDGQMGCRIPMSGPASVSDLEATAMRYGGEILERYGVVRGMRNQQAIDELPRDFAGRLRADT